MLKLYLERLLAALRDNTLIGIIGLATALIAGSYNLGLKIGENRKEDTILSIEEFRKTISDMQKEIELLDTSKSEVSALLTTSNARVVQLENELKKVTSEDTKNPQVTTVFNNEIDALKQQLAKLSSEKLAAQKATMEALAKVDALNRQKLNPGTASSPIESKELVAAAGDVVALMTNDKNWLNYHNVTERSAVYESGYIESGGTKYIIENSKLFQQFGSNRVNIPLNSPKIQSTSSGICFSYFTIEKPTFFKSRKVCRARFVKGW